MVTNNLPKTKSISLNSYLTFIHKNNNLNYKNQILLNKNNNKNQQLKTINNINKINNMIIIKEKELSVQEFK